MEYARLGQPDLAQASSPQKGKPADDGRADEDGLPASNSTLQRHTPRPQSRADAASSSSSPAKSWLSTLRRPRTAPSKNGPTPLPARSHLTDDARRDSALQPGTPGTTITTTSTSTITITSGPPTIADPRESIISDVTSVPAVVVHDTPFHVPGAQKPQVNGATRETFSQVDGDVYGDLGAIDIPTGGFDDLMSPDKLQFSNRGSMLLDGKRAAAITTNGTAAPRACSMTSNSQRAENESKGSLATRQARVMSQDEAELSQRVRSMYDFGNERGVDWTDRTVLDDAVMEEDDDGVGTPAVDAQASANAITGRQILHTPARKPRQSIIAREPHESAGGIEDWQDVLGDEVDRYGFILPKKHESGSSNTASPQLMRVSTALVEVSESPRRKRTIRRSASNASKVHGQPRRRLSKSSRTSLQPPSIMSNHSSTSVSAQQSPLRYASNRLPHNKDRRWMDEASDMLTLPPGLEDLAVAKETGKAAAAIRKKEIQREEKWRRMGRNRSTSTKGGGMFFEFDPRDPKVISRTWKGIPDRWRASAWYSFLTFSAKRHKQSHSDAELIDFFCRVQEESSPDDVQIDCDVPRTINRHIMFRRRYRGGQRLLFRVLHALSLYFPDTGYVQGMAAVAATLLCYFDEEHAFVMMVRLWQTRGLDKLYSAGFGGLMEALEDFEKNWLRGNDVAKKLDELGINSTAYGTRWYLTMFNYSIPFPAQLRVWDAFMLLGDISNASDPKNTFGADLDIMHATSAALVDATRDILLDSDFENVMKVLTSWIPIKDEDLLMKVAFAEWKLRKKRG